MSQNRLKLDTLGFTKAIPSIQLSDKTDVVSTLVTYHLFIKVKAAMDQFKEGLESAGVLSYMKKYFDLITPLFVNEREPFAACKTDNSV